MDKYRLWTESYEKYAFETIEMKEILDDLFSNPPAPATELVDLDLVQEPSSPYSWTVVKRRQRPHRRYTVSNGSPPAPPSTPTYLTANGTSTHSPTASFTNFIDEDRRNSLLYTLDYVPKYKKKLKEQQRTDAELAALFNCFTITGGVSLTHSNGISKGNKLLSERGISSSSRVISKHDSNTKTFKIHRNSKEFSQNSGEDDTVSAPEYVAEREETRHRRVYRFMPSRRQRRQQDNKTKKDMNAVLDNFGASINLNDA